jgi:transcriptional regulator with XRE-family HTH domain
VGATSRDQLYDAFGNYVRSQRQLAQLTLRQAAELASISNPYLSQIEHGFVLPSIAVITALADALSVSTETLLQAAGVLSPTTAEHPRQTEDAIRQDPRLDDGQKHALLAVLTTFVRSPSGSVTRKPVPAEASTRASTRTPRRPAPAGTANSRRRKT